MQETQLFELIIIVMGAFIAGYKVLDFMKKFKTYHILVYITIFLLALGLVAVMAALYGYIGSLIFDFKYTILNSLIFYSMSITVVELLHYYSASFASKSSQ